MSKFVDISCAARMSKTQSHGTISLIPRYIDISRGVDVSRDTVSLMSRFVDVAALSL